MTIGVVAIGRNEGERLKRCLRSVVAPNRLIVYVDSGSTDGSVAFAESLGVGVIALDLSLPFTAARARNEGYEYLKLEQTDSQLDAIFFIDGDCEMQTGWLEHATAELAKHDQLAIVCGQLREQFPDASIYNRSANMEWAQKTGDVEACGGIFVIRVAAFEEVGRFSPSIPAGEEPELCYRLHQRGWFVRRLNVSMALHDAAMLRFGQWWRRQVRSAYGALDVAVRFNIPQFRREIRSARVWAVGWPFAVFLPGLVGAATGLYEMGAIVSGLVLLGLPAQVLRIALGARIKGLPPRAALAYGGLIMLGKLAQVVGQCRYYRDRAQGRVSVTIAYKDEPAAATTKRP